jgi:PAS domain S-box-containing protein
MNVRAVDAEIFKDLVESSEDMIALFDEEGRFLTVNASGAAFLGCASPEEVVGRPLAEFLHPKYREDWRPVVERVLREGRAESLVCVKTARGDTRLLSCVSTRKAAGPSGPVIRTTARDVSNIKRAESALMEGVRSYRALIDAVSDAVYVQDREGRFLDVNRGAVEMYGYAREEFLGRTPEFLSAPGRNDLDALGHRVKAAFAGRTQTFEWWGRRKNGEVFPKEVVLNPAVYFGQEVVIASARDVTLRHGSEEALRRNREFVDRLLETSPVGITVVDRSGRIAFANAAAERILGLNRSAMAARRYDAPEWQITAPDGGPFPAEELPFLKVMRTGEAVADVRHAVVHPDGRRAVLSINAAPLMDASGEVAGMVAALTDVTQGEGILAELREARERLGSLFDNVRHVYFSVEMPSWRMVQISPAFGRIFGVPWSEAWSRPDLWMDRIHAEDREAAKALRSGLAKGEPADAAYRIVRGDGEIRWLHERTVPVNDKHGRVIRLDGILEDVTEGVRLRELEARAQETETIRLLSRGLSHEVRNPLFAIQINLKLLERHLRDDPDGRTAMAHVQEHVSRLNEVMRDVIELGRTVLNRRDPFSPGDAVRLALEALEPEIPGACLRLKREFPPCRGRTVGERAKVARALEHLLRNAFESGGPPDRVAVECLCGERCEIRIRDEGGGIAAPVQASLFHPFVTTKAGHRGLGLALARHYVELHGGSLTASALPERQGTLLVVTLPLTGC